MIPLLLVLSLAAPLPAAADSARQGSIEGTVLAVDDARALAGAGVALLQDGEELRTTVSDAEGRFRFENVPAGGYELRGRAAAFHEGTVEVRVASGETARAELRLSPAVFGLDTLQVVGRAAEVRRGETEFGPRIDLGAIRDLPIPHDPTRMTAFVPGAVEDRVWGGADQTANLYQVDGLAQTHPGDGGPLVALSPAWVQAVEVRGLGAGADQGNFQGAVVNLVTRSGGDAFQSRVRSSVEAHPLNATNITLGEIGRETSFRAEVEAEAGGPILPGRVRYFAAAHLLREDVRARSQLAGVEESFLPFHEERLEARGFGKLSWSPGGRDHLELYGAHAEARVDGWGQNGYLAPGALGRLDSPASLASLSWRRELDEGFLELRATHAGGRESFRPGAGMDRPAVRLYVPGDPPSATYQNAEFALERRPRTRSLSLEAERRFETAGLGHRLRAGAEVSASRWTNRRTRTGGMTWRPPNRTAFDPADASTWLTGNVVPTSWGGEVDLRARMGSDALWIQDHVEVHPRLVLTPGVRLGGWRGDLVPGGRAADRFRAVEDRAWEPRMGVIFEPPGTEDLLLKAHWGRYHQNLLAQFFDRAEGGEVFSDRELWHLSGSVPFDAGVAFTRPEREALAAQDRIRLAERVRLNQTGPVSADYRQPHVEQWIAGAEKSFGGRVRIEALWVDRRNRDIVALRDRNLADNYTRFGEVVVLDRDGEPYLLGGEPLVLPGVHVPNDRLREHILLIATEGVPHLNMPPGMSFADTLGLSFEEDLVLENVADARRHTRQLQLSAYVQGDTWGGTFSFVYTRVTGNFDSVTGYRAGSDFERVWDFGPGPWVRPNEAANAEGDLPGHTPLEAKALLHGEIGWGLRGGAFLQATRGERFTPYFRLSPLANLYRATDSEASGPVDPRLVDAVTGERVFVGPRGSSRYPDRFTLDLRVERDLPLARGDWAVSVDLFNAWNSGAATEINAMVNHPTRRVGQSLVLVDPPAVFGAVWDRLPPRTLRVGVRAAF